MCACVRLIRTQRTHRHRRRFVGPGVGVHLAGWSLARETVRTCIGLRGGSRPAMVLAGTHPLMEMGSRKIGLIAPMWMQGGVRLGEEVADEVSVEEARSDRSVRCSGGCGVIYGDGCRPVCHGDSWAGAVTRPMHLAAYIPAPLARGFSERCGPPPVRAAHLGERLAVVDSSPAAGLLPLGGER